jgi:hypothetical protein
MKGGAIRATRIQKLLITCGKEKLIDRDGHNYFNFYLSLPIDAAG